MALTDKLTAIGNAIRGKTGGTDLLTLDGMVTAINGISTGGGTTLPPEAFNITGDCDHKFYKNGWNWFINTYGSQITTNNITNCNQMFYFNDGITNIPFSINCDSTKPYISCSSLFHGCSQLTVLPEVTVKPFTFSGMFRDCYYLREIPDSYSETFDFTYLNSSGGGCNSNFDQCYSLRKIPSGFLKKIYCPSTNKARHLYYYGFRSCYCLDEIVGLPIGTVVISGNAFTDTFTRIMRAKNVIFDTNEDGTAKTAQWSNQTIDLQTAGHSTLSVSEFLNYNSGITADKEVIDDATYAALKNDPDWFTEYGRYSRYNKTSAIATINSLPDTSAYIAANGGTNTIKFKGEAGSATDGGAINTMTEEQIAVATAKGWTVSFA